MESKFLSLVVEICPDKSRRIFLLRRDGGAIPVTESSPLQPQVEVIWPIMEYWLETQGYLLEDKGPAKIPPVSDSLVGQWRGSNG